MFFFFMSVFTISQSASTVWYYTTLKHTQVKMSKDHCFSTLWNYTTLKQSKTNWNCLWVSVPYEITLLSNFSALDSDKDEFQYLMKLHHSQTINSSISDIICFSTLWNYTTLKHSCPATRDGLCFSTLWNYTTLKPALEYVYRYVCFSTLWNYTTLKLILKVSISLLVSVPYEITLLSNVFVMYSQNVWVSVPYEITLLSNENRTYYTKEQFQYLMKLHYSQTSACLFLRLARFSTLWNYTTLKLAIVVTREDIRFSTLWNYTTLKLDWYFKCNRASFSTLWNYTTLKRSLCLQVHHKSFSTLWNYTTLKHYDWCW